LFLRVSGTLWNPPGNSPKLTMPAITVPGTRRVEMTLSPDGIRRLKALQKMLGFAKRSEVMEALLFKAAVEQKIDPDLSARLEQKIDYLIERIDLVT